MTANIVYENSLYRQQPGQQSGQQSSQQFNQQSDQQSRQQSSQQSDQQLTQQPGQQFNQQVIQAYEQQAMEEEQDRQQGNRQAERQPENIHTAMAAIMRAMPGIGKNGRTAGTASYAYRRIEDVYNALHPLLARFGVVVLPEVVEWKSELDANKRYHNVLILKVTFMHASGTSCQCVSIGEAVTSSDKGFGICFSYAMKNAYMHAFCIPVEGMADESPYDTGIYANEQDARNNRPMQKAAPRKNARAQAVSEQPAQAASQSASSQAATVQPAQAVASQAPGQVVQAVNPQPVQAAASQPAQQAARAQRHKDIMSGGEPPAWMNGIPDDDYADMPVQAACGRAASAPAAPVQPRSGSSQAPVGVAVPVWKREITDAGKREWLAGELNTILDKHFGGNLDAMIRDIEDFIGEELPRPKFLNLKADTVIAYVGARMSHTYEDVARAAAF